MSTFKLELQNSSGHLVIAYEHTKDSYTWKIVGKMPVAHLIGYIIRVQAELAFRNPDPCDPGVCAILFNTRTNKMCWFVDSKIPVDSLVGTLELVKAALVDHQLTQIAQAAQRSAQTSLIGADGKPILKGRDHGS